MSNQQNGATGDQYKYCLYKHRSKYHIIKIGLGDRPKSISVYDKDLDPIYEDADQMALTMYLKILSHNEPEVLGFGCYRDKDEAERQMRIIENTTKDLQSIVQSFSSRNLETQSN